MLPWTNYGRDKFWLVGYLCSEPRLAMSQNGGMRHCDVCQVLRWSRRAWVGECGPCPYLCIIYPGVCLTSEEKLRKTLSQGNPSAFGWSAPNTIRLVDLAIARGGLDWHAVPCRPWLSRQATGLTLVQLKYVPSCRARRFPASAICD